MSSKRLVEVFSAGCPACDEGVALVQRLACPSCDVRVLSMNDPDVAQRAADLGIQTVPAGVIDGALAGCCASRGLDETVLTGLGLGRAIPGDAV